jgi:hypothetical protein
VRFECDEKKRAENIRKHGLDFADARQIFEAPMLVDMDKREDYDETRFIGVGFLKNIIVVIVFTEPDAERIRVISLRKALKYERERFEEFIRNELDKT